MVMFRVFCQSLYLALVTEYSYILTRCIFNLFVVLMPVGESVDSESSVQWDSLAVGCRVTGVVELLIRAGYAGSCIGRERTRFDQS